MNKAVLLITFNRLEETKRTFEQVAIAKPPRLYLASDGERPNKDGEKEKVEEIRAWLLENVNWDCEIKTRFLDTNSGGCRYGVSSAIDWFFETEEDGIILEDDLVASQSFFSFCEELLDYHKDNKEIWHISGNNFLDDIELQESYYFARIEYCWGWATWKNRWLHYHEGLKNYNEEILNEISPRLLVQKYWRNILHRMQAKEIDSWAYQWTLIIISHRAFCINPTKNLVSNIGETGVHYTGSKDPMLNLPTFDINKIIHPKKVEFISALDEKIYEKAFRIFKPTMKFILKYMYRHPLFILRKQFWKMIRNYNK